MGRAKLPATWREALGEAASATLSRRFNWVRNLEVGERVLLRVESPQRVSRVTINGAESADGEQVDSLLTQANQFRVELTCEAPDDAILEAWLEITDGSE